MDAALLLLVDGRFPAGGHAYSAGVEAAVAIGDVVDAATLERYLEGRLATTGTVDAAFAAAACGAERGVDQPGGHAERVDRLDTEYSARMPSPYLRTTSRRLGRQLLRAAQPIWSTPWLDAVAATPDGPHQPIALGAVVAAAGGDPGDAVALSFHHLTAAVTSAAIRLLGLDPIALAALQARVGARCDAARADAAGWATAGPATLPAAGGTLTEILGEQHGSLDARMFVA
ncbi:MAG: urease accessory protein UreF [Acidimicrobiales bacterium]